ncbi:MAG: CocE/NonD family hydrolase, partial [candidate division WS1 bacterium]|nr:CocE/NonD family hydrolase [candidate division WS1 bacterium]
MSVAQTQMCSAPAYEAIVERDIMMSLRDGVRLATDLYFPALDDEKIDQRFPVVLTRTPYDKLGRDTTGKWFAERGYVFAAQDVRGRYASEGVFYPYAHEGPDGYDTVEWLAQQPFCTGKVGTLGSSYGASVISALAALNPPHLAAIIHLFGPSSHYHCSMRNNGTLEMRFFAYALSMAATSREAAADPALKQALEEARADVWAWAKQYPLRKGNSPLRLVPSYEQWAIDISTHATYDDYWKQPGYGPRPYYDQHADVPSLYIGGWYDSYTLAVVENFQELSKRGKAPVHMLMGPWHHGSPGTAISGDLSFKPDATLSDCNALYLRWFDHWLKGLPTGLDETKSVRYFIMGGGEGLVEASPTIEHGGKWATCDAWPPPNTTPTPF